MSDHIFSYTNKNQKHSLDISTADVDHYLAIHFQRYNYFSDKDIRHLHEYWNVNLIKKNMLFFQKHENTCYNIIAQGALKLFVSHGVAQLVKALLTENDSWAVRKENATEETAYHVVKDVILLSLTPDNMQNLLTDRPVFTKFFIEQNEREISFLQNRVTALLVLSAYERYEELHKNRPEVLANFNLQDIANYLGMKAETLSRIRNPALKNVS